MAIKLVFTNNNLGQIERVNIRCKICQVTNVCINPFRQHCIACGQRLSKRYHYMPNFTTVRYKYHSLGVE